MGEVSIIPRNEQKWKLHPVTFGLFDLNQIEYENSTALNGWDVD